VLLIVIKVSVLGWPWMAIMHSVALYIFYRDYLPCNYE